MTKKELIESLYFVGEDEVIVISDGTGWDNITEVNRVNGVPTITFGGSPFSDE